MLTAEQKEEILKVGLFDFISNNWHNLDKELLAKMFKEFTYNVYIINKEVEAGATMNMLEEIND